VHGAGHSSRHEYAEPVDVRDEVAAEDAGGAEGDPRGIECPGFIAEDVLDDQRHDGAAADEAQREDGRLVAAQTPPARRSSS
jgi:hypothetical protein